MKNYILIEDINTDNERVVALFYDHADAQVAKEYLQDNDVSSYTVTRGYDVYPYLENIIRIDGGLRIVKVINTSLAKEILQALVWNTDRYINEILMLKEAKEYVPYGNIARW